MLSFERYCGKILEMLDIPAQPGLTRESTLEEDLGIDSLQLLEMVIISEQLAGRADPSAHVPAISTLGDVYAYYSMRLGEG